MEFSLAISANFPLLSDYPNKGVPCLLRQLVHQSSAKTFWSMPVALLHGIGVTK
jgi:hypothetical protein